MAILAIYPRTKSLHVAAWSDTLQETAVFPFSTDDISFIDKQLLPWLSAFMDTSHDLQFIVTSVDGKVFASALAAQLGVPVHTIDRSSDAECLPVSLVTGTPSLQRRCAADTFIFTYLARQEARTRGLELTDAGFIVAHLSEENQFGALRGTSVLDTLTSLDEGPFALRHSGGLPFDGVLDLCMAASNKEEVLHTLHQEGGLAGYLGIEHLDDLWSCQGEKADAVREVLVYQISKEIGALATVLRGKVQAIILAGELVRHDRFREALSARVSFIAPIAVYGGDQGLPALLDEAKCILQHNRRC